MSLTESATFNDTSSYYVSKTGTSIAGVLSLQGQSGALNLASSDSSITIAGSPGVVQLTTTGNALAPSSITASAGVSGASFTTVGAVNCGSVVASGNVGSATVSASGAITGASLTTSGAVSVGSAFSALQNPLWGSSAYCGSENIAGAIPDATTIQLTALNTLLASSPFRNVSRQVFVSCLATPATAYANGTLNVAYGVSIPAFQSGTGNSAVAITGANQANGCNINIATTGSAGARVSTLSFTNGSGIPTDATGLTYFWFIV
jgi:hypothetical protein